MAVFDVKAYGAVGNGTTDDRSAIQAAIDDAVGIHGTVLFPATTGGEYRITGALSITGDVRIVSEGLTGAGLFCDACDGITVSAGVARLEIGRMRFSQKIRYSTAPNAYAGIRINGTTAAQCYRHTYRDVFVDGFETGIVADGVCSSLFDNLEVVHAKNGITAGQQTLNNVVSNCRFSGCFAAGGAGIRIGDGGVNAEGWRVLSVLTYQFARGVWLHSAAYCKVAHCVLDYSSEFGVLLQSGATQAVVACDIEMNYIGLTGSADTGIFCVNAQPIAADQDFGHTILGNVLLTYSDSTSNRGILVDGEYDDRHFIVGNRIGASELADCEIRHGTRHFVAANQWLGPGYFATVRTDYDRNTGVLLASPDVAVRQSAFLGVRSVLAYGTVVSTDADRGSEFVLTATNGSAFTIANPDNPSDGKRITLTVRNGSGSPLGTITWGALFRLAPWTNPASGYSRSITFRFDGTNWIEIGRTPIDVPN